MSIQERYMQRCLQLAAFGAGNTAPNPMVGALLVHDDKIIGEGYHQQYGGPHAEVNCINSVTKNNIPHIDKSTLYVSLEPCSHYGKTPPCSKLIIDNKIPNVVIGCRDNYKEVNGNGIKQLKAAGVNVKTGVLEKEALQLNKRFFTFHENKRPYIILKWAQSMDGKIAGEAGGKMFISNEYTNRLVHRWRSEEAAIMVGTNTALSDNPSLTTRLWAGNNPLRLVIDKSLKLPPALHLLDGSVKTIVFNTIKTKENATLYYYKIEENKNCIAQITAALYTMNIQSVIVEGGAKLLQSFIDVNCWDEARIITNDSMIIGNGINAPQLSNHILEKKYFIQTDSICVYQHH